MTRLVHWLEKYVLPIATKLGQVRWLVALRDAFISTLPITLVGSLAVLFASFVHVAKVMWHWRTFAFALQPFVNIANLIWKGTFALFALYFALSWGYQLARTFEVNRQAGAIVSLACFAMSIANIAQVKIKGQLVNVNNVFDIKQMSTTGLFTAMIFGGLGMAVFILCDHARLTLRTTVTMPHAEQAAFEALIPSILALIAVGGINYLFQRLTGTFFGNWLFSRIQAPLIKMGQGFGMVMLVTFLVQVFWFFGINGTSVLAPVMESLWLTPENLNVMAVRNGRKIPYTWVRSSFDVFAWFGGAGGTLMLIIAILIVSKRSDFRTLAKMALAPSFFNLNEPVMFGLPIVLNTIYLIPFLVAPLVNVATAYWVTQLGWVNPVQANVPSIVPPLIAPFLATNYDFRSVLLCLFNMVIAFLIWLPFVLAADKVADAINTTSPFFKVHY